MQRNVVAASQVEIRERLHLSPRLRCDETLSSWMERFAGAYGMTLREFARWIGYRNLYSAHGQLTVDLDVSPPGDLPPILSALAGVSEEIIRTHELSALDVLPAGLRRAFCPQCWSEEGPYRRREWASAWALVCTRHQQLLITLMPTQRPRFGALSKHVGRDGEPPGRVSQEFGSGWADDNKTLLLREPSLVVGG
jgi:TniQ